MSISLFLFGFQFLKIQVSVSFADQSTTSVIEISEEGGSGDAPSSSTARPTASDDSNLETTEARLARYHLTASVESSTTGENEKDKTDEKKKISPLQLRRLSTIQVVYSSCALGSASD